MIVHRLRTEHQTDPLGIDTRRPRLSWELLDDRRSVMQAAYQVAVAPTVEALLSRVGLYWDSGRVDSDASLDIVYAGDPVCSRQRYFWTVRVWTESDGEPSEWASPAVWEMGLLDEADWVARWVEPVQRPAIGEAPISPGDVVEGRARIEADHALLNPAQYMRRSFSIVGEIARARIYATAHGVYELELNGARVGRQELAPEYTAVDEYLMYQTYDVTQLVREGANVVGAVVADGWYAGRLGITGASANWGDRLGLLMQLEITLADGGRITVGTDESFCSSTGPIRYADLLIGEKYDARLEQSRWSTADFDPSSWVPVRTASFPLANLVAHYGEPLRVIAEIPAMGVMTTPDGGAVVDFGQNIAGHIRMRVSGPAGAEVVLEHSQTLDSAGNFFLNILGRNNENRDVYVLKGDGREEFEPRLTYHGFRYVKVTGYPGTIDPRDFLAIAVSSVEEPAAYFSSTSPALNQLHNNVQWTMRSNLFSVPTDNPDRERAGWAGDLQIILPTAAQLFEIQPFLTRWFRNMVLEQFDDGLVPMVVPYFSGYRRDLGDPAGIHTYAGWGDVAVIGPWLTYLAYGDIELLAETYDAGEKWLAYVATVAEGTLTDDDRSDPDRALLWRATAFHFGDWLTPSSTTVNEHGLYGAANNFANVELVPTLYFAYSSDVMVRIAAVLGREEDSRRYAEQAAAIRRGFGKAFVTDDRRLSQDTQGMYVLALQFEMVESELRPHFVNRLVDLIRANGSRLDTGFLSTAYLLPLLCDEGHETLAFDLLLQESAPSWLYQVRKGATTVWELWTAVQESGDVTRISQNQPGLSTVGDFLHRYVGGVRPDAPAYKRIIIEPRIDTRVGGADVRVRVPYGWVASRWERSDGAFRIEVEVPPNTTAVVRMPRGVRDVHEGDIAVSEAAGTAVTLDGEDRVIVEIGSGAWAFTGRFEASARPGESVVAVV